VYEKSIVVKRTIWEAKCDCGESEIKVKNPPREWLCRCGKWVKYKEKSYTGVEIKKQGKLYAD
jgi:CDGSH-type Zn-finger protein